MATAIASAQSARNSSPLNAVNARSGSTWKDEGVPTFGNAVAAGIDGVAMAGRGGEAYVPKPTVSAFIFGGRTSVQRKLDMFHAQRSAKHRDRIALELQSDPVNAKSIKHSLAILSKLDLKLRESGQRAYLGHSESAEAARQATTLSEKLAAMVEDASAWSADDAHLKDMARTLVKAWRLEGKGEGDKWIDERPPSDIEDHAKLGVYVQQSAVSPGNKQASAAAVKRFAMHRDLVQNELQQNAPDMNKILLSLQVLENLWLKGIRPEAQPIESFGAGVLAQSLVMHARNTAVVDADIDTRFNAGQKLVLDALLDSWDPVNRLIDPGILSNAPAFANLEKDKDEASLALDKAHNLGRGRQDAIKKLNAAKANVEFRKIVDERFAAPTAPLKVPPKAAAKGVAKHGQMTHALTLREPVKTSKNLKDAICHRALDLDEARFVVAGARDRFSKVSASSGAGRKAKRELKECEAKLEDLRMQFTELRKELIPLLTSGERREFEQQYPANYGLPS